MSIWDDVATVVEARGGAASCPVKLQLRAAKVCIRSAAGEEWLTLEQVQREAALLRSEREWRSQAGAA